MADCQSLFSKYNDDLNITATKRDRLKKAKEALRERIKDYFKEHHPEYVPQFFIQGSYKMKTMIRTKDNECDLDDGVYFLRKPDVTATVLQKWVYEAVEEHTTGGQQHRKKCIRVIYSGDYHIDIPVYYMFSKTCDHPFLAVKNEGWQESDPKEFLEWFRDVKTSQMVRISRYLKGWCDHKRNNMPSGLAIAVLTQKNLIENERDDIALRETLKAIKNSLKVSWMCVMPTTPKDDLFSKYNETFKNNFFTALDDFIADADSAIDEGCCQKPAKNGRSI
ncbi:MAG: nucleotidyltransferase [Haliscomenobacter sp.]|nr:nucleotidyltransferase [Haliscomenobacter sp.]